MKRITVPLLLGLTVAAVGCGKSDEAPVAGATAFSISGSLKTTSTALTLNASRIDLYDEWAAQAPQYSMLVAYTDFLVACVTFAVPPEAANGTVAADGKFTVNFASGLGQSFGCFVTKPADPDFVIPMVFKDATKKSMNGDAKKDTRLAVTGSIQIPEVSLDLDNGTAEVDTATIVKTETGTAADVVKTVTGEKFDFTGSWVIESLAANNMTLPAGYKKACTFDEMFEEEWTRSQSQDWSGTKTCEGPIIGMNLYLLRMAGKNWVQDDACKAAVAASKASGTAVSTCGGSQGTEDRYAIKIWAPEGGGGGNLAGCGPGGVKETCKASMKAMIDGLSPKAGFHTCGRRMGFKNVEAKAFGEVDFSADTNYVASGSSSSEADTKYYEGAFPFMTSVTITNSNDFGDCGGGSQCKPFKAATSTITEGWKLSQAQTQWAQQNNCKPVDVMVGTQKAKAWRCYGDYFPSCGESNPQLPCAVETGGYAAFNEGAGMGCKDEAGKPVQFNNWNEFWCQYNDGCQNAKTELGNVSWLNSDGTTTAAGYTVAKYTSKAGFVPKDNNSDPITVTGAVTCDQGGGLFNATTGAQITGENTWSNFRVKQASAGVLCSEMVIDGTQEEQNRKLLAQLQCYANAYHRGRGSFTGCTRDMRFNWGAKDPWDFVAQNDGPSKANGEVIFELFNYTDAKSGNFSTVESHDEGLRVKDANGGDMWVPCRVNSSETITVNAISDTKIMFELSSVRTLANKDNAQCVAAATAGDIEVGTSKQMFVMSKQ